MKRQEQEVLEAQSIPLREYLMENVMPSLTQALIEVCKVNPEDPIDYIVFYLCKMSGRVFNTTQRCKQVPVQRQ